MPNFYKPFCASTCIYNCLQDEILIFGGAVSKYIYEQSETPLIIYSLSPEPNEQGKYIMNKVNSEEEKVFSHISNASFTSMNINCYLSTTSKALLGC